MRIISALADAAWADGFRTVFPKLGFQVHSDLIEEIMNCKSGSAEKLLVMLRKKLDENNTTDRGLCHDILFYAR